MRKQIPWPNTKFIGPFLFFLVPVLSFSTLGGIHREHSVISKSQCGHGSYPNQVTLNAKPYDSRDDDEYDETDDYEEDFTPIEKFKLPKTHSFGLNGRSASTQRKVIHFIHIRNLY